MKRVRHLAIGAALAALVAGGGTASLASPGDVVAGAQTVRQQHSALISIPTTTTCGGGSASVLTAMIQAKPGPTCGCSKKCPLENPPASCGPNEKVKKVEADCNYAIICSGQTVQCSIKVKVETCVPKNGPVTDV